MNKKMIFYTLGKMIKIEGILLSLPFLVGVIYKESASIYFLIVGVIALAIGHLLSYKKPKDTALYALEGFVIVALAWIIFSLIGALPFYLSKEIPSFVDAFFETVSGFTTTGSTILNEIEGLSMSILFWRSFSHWIGGMGILVFVVAFISDAPGTIMQILKAEMPGPVVGKLVSKVNVTAKILYKIYAAMTIAETIFLMFGGLPFFDALVTSFATAGTGGFAIKNASIAAYNSAYVDYVIGVFMLLFGINFNLFYFFLIKRFKEAFGSEELHWYIGIIAVCSVVIGLNIMHLYSGFMEAFRYSFFQVSSIITTTGFITADYEQWPLLSQTILMLLIFVGASAGSTGGGIKVARIIMVVKTSFAKFKQLVHPRSVVSVRFEGKVLPNSTISNVHTYLGLYAIVFVVSLLFVSLQNIDFSSAFTAVATCLNNVGPGLGVVGPVNNFSSLTDLAKLVLSFDMLAGRLEIFPMLILFFPSLWKK